ncbi:MAG: AAA family ATPase [Deferrisomatales bacterium]
MYLEHFGLAQHPFALTPDPRFLYLGEHHREALAHLLYGLGEGGGFVQLTGEVGTGKTTLCRTLLEQAPVEVDVALVLNPRQTPGELVASICDELGVERSGGGDPSLKVLVDALNRHLLQSHAAGRRTVVVIDEAQGLSVAALEQVRLLTNLETTTHKLLQMLLIGQPELRQLMARRDLRQLAQRVTARFHLAPLTGAETAEYVRHRLRVAGARDPIFTDGALTLLARLSGGVPRVVNALADRALLGAYAEGVWRVGRGIVRRAAAEVGGRAPRRARARAVAWGAVAVALAAAWIAVTGPWARRPAGPAVAVEAPPPWSGLGALLAGEWTDTGTDQAFGTLFARWGLDYGRLPGGTACERAAAAGLRCLYERGGWAALAGHDRPAVLELVAGSRRHHVAAVALDAETVTLAGGGGEHRVSRAEVEALWSGDFVLLWRPDPPTPGLLHEGSRGPDVARLRELLAQADGRPPAGATPADRFDDELRRRVESFQALRGLEADGLVGERTWAELAEAARRRSGPALARPAR